MEVRTRDDNKDLYRYGKTSAQAGLHGSKTNFKRRVRKIKESINLRRRGQG